MLVLFTQEHLQLFVWLKRDSGLLGEDDCEDDCIDLTAKFYTYIFTIHFLFLHMCSFQLNFEGCLKSIGFVHNLHIKSSYECAVLGTAEPAWHPALPLPLLTSPYKSCVRLLPPQLFRDHCSQGIWSAIPAQSTCSFHATIFQQPAEKLSQVNCNWM